MDSALFLEQFGHLAYSPDGVQKLRSMILDLAVRGKLVEQFADDEPASELIKRIEAEKKQLYKAGEIKKPKKLPKISDTEKPYNLPHKWLWVRLGEITNYGNMEKIEPEEATDPELWVLDLQDIEKIASRVLQKVRLKDRAFQSSKNLFHKGDVLYGKLRPYLDKVIVADEMGVTTTEVIPFNSFGCISPYYLRWFMKSSDFIRYADNSTHGMNLPRLSTKNAQLAIVPLPPLAEQKRIVAKVDELMALCDQLEAEQAHQRQLVERSVKSTFHHLTNAPTKTEAHQYWGYAEEHFSDLFDRVTTIKELRATILQLAVQGRLVPQNPEDEPASELLKQIDTEKKRLIKAGEIKKPKKLKPIDEDEVPYDLPDSWEWARFPDLGEFGRGKSKHRPRNDPSLYKDGKYPLVQTGNVTSAINQHGLVLDYHSLYNEVGLKQSKLWSKGAMCITIAANIADTGILSFDACIPDSIVGFIPFAPIEDVRYFEYFMRTAKSMLDAYAPATAQKNINLGILSTVMIPIPPLSEMRCIVEKINGLMQLCDQLEQEVEQSQYLSGRLFDSIIHHLFEN